MEHFGYGKIIYINKFAICQPILLNDGFFSSRKSQLYAQFVKLEIFLRFIYFMNFFLIRNPCFFYKKLKFS